MSREAERFAGSTASKQSIFCVQLSSQIEGQRDAEAELLLHEVPHHHHHYFKSSFRQLRDTFWVLQKFRGMCCGVILHQFPLICAATYIHCGMRLCCFESAHQYFWSRSIHSLLQTCSRWFHTCSHLDPHSSDYVTRTN